MKFSYSAASFVLAAHLVAAASNDSDQEPILSLSSDSSFHFQILSTLGAAVYGGADIGPVLGASKGIVPGDMESFSEQFHVLAKATKKQAEDLESADEPANVRDTWFSAATYFRAADFYLHGNWSDPRINSFWEEQTTAFDKALTTLPIPGQRVRIPAKEGNFTVEAIWYAASENKHAKLPTLIIGNGYDASQEESYHVFVVPALARGWNCITYEGPGQPTVRRNQNIGFIPDWEKVVTPVVDYVLSEKSDVVDQDRLALFGNSMGGYLAARAVAFEPRISAVLLDGAIWDIYAAYSEQLPPAALAVFNAGNQTEFDNMIFELRNSGELPTTVAWGIDQGLWAFYTHSTFDFLTQTKRFTIKDVVDKIKIPVWIADAEHEGFFPGQPRQVKSALGDRATLHRFTGVAGYHCQVGAVQELSRVMFDWLSKTLGKRPVPDGCQRKSRRSV